MNGEKISRTIYGHINLTPVLVKDNIELDMSGSNQARITDY